MNSLQRLEDVRPQKSTVPFSSLCAHLWETGEILGKGDFSFSSQGDGSAFLDTELLFQVYENLLSNAGRYAQKQVWARAALERGWLSLTVGDDGPGFPPAALKRAAEPYYRADKSLSPQGELALWPGAVHLPLPLRKARRLAANRKQPRRRRESHCTIFVQPDEET